MDEWETLVSFGLPDGAARPPPCRFDDAAVRAAFLRAAMQPGPREREILSAWLAAFHHHWPARFAAVFGAEADHALRSWRSEVDPNRYLKLRRIAVENLSRVL